MNRVSATVGVSQGGTGRATLDDYPGVGPLGLTPVPLAGGVTVWIDPVHPDDFTRVDAWPSEPTGQPVLHALFGTELSASLSDAADSTLGRHRYAERSVTVALDPEYWPHVARLGFLLWLEQYTVLPLEQGDFDLEIGLLASRLGGLVEEKVVDDRFERAQDHLVGRLEQFGRDQVAPVTLLDAFDVAARGYLDLADARTDELVELASGMRAEVAYAPPFTLVERLRSPFGTIREDVASIAGLADSGTAHEAFSVDWRLVPRGILDTEEATVTAVWLDGATPRLSVTVLASPYAGRGSGALLFGVRTKSSTEYRAAGALEYDAESGTYSGSCHLDTPLGPADLVEAYSVLSIAPRAVDSELDRLTGVREATRGFLAERLPNNAGAFDAAMLRLAATDERWKRAGQAFATAADRSGSEADRLCARISAARRTALRAIPRDSDAADWIATLPPLALAEQFYFGGHLSP